ncbi:hypothetical protein BGZ83_007489 [Gryganskiella cystojenkinii]|nr:hypothetical protein BGZ83_007489 [Gryganskiella cystojenkinii]
MDSRTMYYKGNKRRLTVAELHSQSHRREVTSPQQPLSKPGRKLSQQYLKYRKREQTYDTAEPSTRITSPLPSPHVSLTSNWIPPPSPSGTATTGDFGPRISGAIGAWSINTTPTPTPEVPTPTPEVPTPTFGTAGNGGQAPLESLPVQLILGGLAGIIILAVTLRCVYINRHRRAVLLSRERNDNLSIAQRQAALHASAVAGTVAGQPVHLVPTNGMTLAARLNAYQAAQSDSRRYYYPYQQEPIGAAAGGRDGDAFSSVVSFVAPSYQHDVSPPPFMVDAGKPPAYAAAIAEAVNIMRQPLELSDLTTPPQPARPPSSDNSTLNSPTSPALAPTPSPPTLNPSEPEDSHSPPSGNAS